MDTQDQIPIIKKVLDQEYWYVGEKFGTNPRYSKELRAKVEIRVAEIVLDGLGRELRDSKNPKKL